MAIPVKKQANKKDQHQPMLANCFPDLSGKVLSNRYQLLSVMAQGSFGVIYKATDLSSKDRPIIIKISKDLEMCKKEYKILRKITDSFDHSAANFYVPKVYTGGEFKTISRAAKVDQ